jgi:DNA-binding CsgD family transcriptional regulator/tetratricopeptide (TPR) repeat protein
LITTMVGQLLGRQSELARLQQVLDDARHGERGALVVRGVPGVGKTALITAVASGAQDFLILTVTGIQSESDLPFSALTSLLAPVLDRLDRLPSVQAASLRAALGLLPDTQVQRLACYAGVMTLLADAAARRPVLVVIDDFQWVDESSQHALLFALRRLESDPVAFLVAIREGEREQPRLTGVAELRLAGLGEAASHELLRAGGRPVADAVATHVWAATAGNPLALAEVGRQLSGDQLAGLTPLSDPLPIGGALMDAFARRVRSMPATTRQALILAAASYTGSATAVTSALRVLGLPLIALEAAETAGLVRLENGGLQWRHPLVRAAVYQRASPRERRAAHQALAAADESALAEHRAWHLAAAAVAPDEAVAGALEQVAEEAVRRSALATAAHALDRAASLTPNEAERARREVAAAEYAAAVGRWDEATDLLDRSHQHSSDLLLRAQSERIRARVEILRGTPAAAQGRLVAIADRLEETQPALAAEILTEAVVAHQVAGDRQAYTAIASRALALAQRVGGRHEAVAALVIAAARVAHGETETAVELYGQFGAAAAEPALWHSAPEISAMYAYCQMSLENFAEAERLLAATIDGSRAAGSVRGLTYFLAQRGLLDLRLGRTASALAAAEESVELSRAMLEGAMLAYALAVLARVKAVLGQVQESAEHASESIRMSQSMGAHGIEAHALAALSTLAVSIPDWEGVARELQRLHPTVVEWVHEPGWLHTDADLVEALFHTADRGTAEAQLVELERRAAATRGTWAHAVSARCRGLFAADDTYDEHFKRALAWHSRAPLPLERARTELLYGQQLRRRRRRSDARAQLASASATFHALGASVWAERADQELAAAGYGPPGPAGASPWARLTAAEARVVQVIVEGATYQQAAAQLFVSPRTVESHLRQAYRKLGVRSRAELSRALSAPAEREAASEASG